MNIVTRMKDWILNLDEREFYQFCAAFIGSLMALVLLFLYMRYSSSSSSYDRLKRINQLRTEARQLLQEHESVLQQQREVDALLAKDPAFLIKEYFLGIMRELRLEQTMTKPAEVSEPQELSKGYNEIKLEASCSDLNMRQLTDLLYKIEQNERIYTKELVITKATKTPTIDVTLVIATLQQQPS